MALPSWVVGTIGIWVLLIIAVVISHRRPLRVLLPAEQRRLFRWGALAWVAQGAHFIEEYRSGFFTRWPEVLGLNPWSPAAFAAFNLGWLGIWAAALWTAPRGYRVAEWPIWFLALALLINAVAHPLIARAVGGYFPGLLTAVPAGLAGGFLLAALHQASAPPPG